MYRKKIKIKGKVEEIDKSESDFNILMNQVALLDEYLESVWEGKQAPFFKYPNADKVKYELCFNERFVATSFEEVLEYKVTHEEIFIDEEKNGVQRIYDTQNYFQLVNNFYNFLEFKWQEAPIQRLDDIWTEYRMHSEFTLDDFCEIIQLLRQKLIILLLRDEEGNVVVKKNSNSGKTKEDT